MALGTGKAKRRGAAGKNRISQYGDASILDQHSRVTQPSNLQRFLVGLMNHAEIGLDLRHLVTLTVILRERLVAEKSQLDVGEEA